MATATIEPTVDDAKAFADRLTEATAAEAKSPPRERMVNGKPVVWAPQEGSQTAFLSCPIFEVLYHGTRGPGKTDALLMSFAQHVGKGYGKAWRGIIFRQTYPQLADLVAKSEKWFRRIFPGAKFIRSAPMRWVFETGEELRFAHLAKVQDYDNYHGHEYPYIGWEELTNWASDECYRKMFACCRSSSPDVPRMIRATTNPYGVGHNWIKTRFGLQGQWWKTRVIQTAPMRAAIHGHLRENKILLAADPHYEANILASASNPALVAAWLKGSWDIVAGGIFDDLWKPDRHIVEPFAVPESWRLDRAFDWGSSAPFSVGWYAESDGSDWIDAQGNARSSVRGDLFRIDEWYGWTGQPNQGVKMLAVDVARGIIERELANWPGRKFQPGPADSAIYSVENGNSIAEDMAKPVTIGGKPRQGVKWRKADKSPGSRATGWEMVRKFLKGAHPNADGTPREKPGLFVFESCEQFIRTVPSAPRSKRKPDDLDTDSEDHIADEVRYRVRSAGRYRSNAAGIGPGDLGSRLVQGS